MTIFQNAETSLKSFSMIALLGLSACCCKDSPENTTIGPFPSGVNLNDQCFIPMTTNLSELSDADTKEVSINIREDGSFHVATTTQEFIDGLNDGNKDINELLKGFGFGFLNPEPTNFLGELQSKALEGGAAADQVTELLEALEEQGYVKIYGKSSPGHFELNLKKNTKIKFRLYDDKWVFPTRGLFHVSVNPLSIPNGYKVPMEFQLGDPRTPEIEKEKVAIIHYKHIPITGFICNYEYNLAVKVRNDGMETTIIIDPPIKNDGTQGGN